MKIVEMGSKDLLIDTVMLKSGAAVYRAINNDLRRQMLRQLHRNGTLTVTSLYMALKLEQSVASQHLAILRKANLVKTERTGKYVFYSVNYERLSQLHVIAASLLTNEPPITYASAAASLS